ncbi:hypothetical protein RvY_09267-2 [Ramazzottius varieornatus]|uniref:Cation/H+ exchanger transmembrane domain-containing protein n=1 Tax=Ramazzottius varieornatus TaxID=947166 RepID=A0A1D1V8P6_RAMVA|nr:hypothetical protein RvY_09267-2 [Ramazzottius varieornatus]
MDMWNESLVTPSGTLINGTALEMQELSSSADPLDGNATDLPLDVHSLYEHTPPPYSILSVFVIILLGVFMRYLQPRLPIPYTVVIMLLGVIYGLVAAKAYPPLLNYTAMTRIDPHWILHLFLPALIFESSFAINLGMFRSTMGSILLLATVGLAIATGLTSIVVRYAFSYGWDWCTSLMFGALISATDPVAVVALLKDVGTSPALGVVLEGESLLNDGTAIILFNIFLALSIPSDNFSGESLAVQSVLTVAGGPLFGFAAGWTLVGLLGKISSDAISEVCLTLTAAYLTFYVSEAVLGISGVLAVVALGVVMNSQRTVISPEVDPWMHEFWDIITYIANTLIFVIVGLTIAEHALFNFENMDWINLLILWPALIVIRLISIVVCLPLIRCVEKTGTCNWKNVLVMSWGGLRGAVSLALAMTVSRDPRLDQDSIGNKVLVHTSGIVMLTLLVNGTTTAKLLSVLGMSRIPEDTISAVDNALRFIFKKRDEKITSLKKDHFLEDVNWGSVTSYTLLQNPYKRSRNTQQKKEKVVFSSSFAEKCKSETETDLERTLYSTLDYKAARRIWLQLLKSHFWIQFEHGMVCRRTLLYLSSCVDAALARSEGLIDPEVITGRFTIGHKLTYCQKLVNKLSGHDTSWAGQGRDAVEPAHGNWAERIVEVYWFKSVVHTLLCIHVSCSVLNLIWNFHGHHLDENFFHENVYFVTANGMFDGLRVLI